MYRVLLKGCFTAKGYVSTDSKNLNKLLVVYLCFFVLVSSLEFVCFFVFFQGACHGGCVSGIDHVCHVSVGISDYHGPVWHRDEFGICGPVVFVPSHGFGLLGVACQVPFDSCMRTGH